ncbi:hypothetical protein ACEUAI_20875 [Aeromonas veronii]|uniref:hypothetical protein n=1 Tax=Aeromonas hydrophila TaxID=644 RepID=UPI00288FD64B|nr:hypothetical protein [Aeromonas hydrophila]HDX8426108.1 hypothetical protein [Aeromonas veronii]
MAKVTFKPVSEQYSMPGDNCVRKEWDIKDGKEVVGLIVSTIRDLNQDYANPGYSVMVKVTINGVEKEFYRYSNAMSNRSMVEAKANRSSYVNAAKQWAIKGIAAKATVAA